MEYTDYATARRAAHVKDAARENSTRDLAQARADLAQIEALRGTVPADVVDAAAAAVRERIAFHNWVEQI